MTYTIQPTRLIRAMYPHIKRVVSNMPTFGSDHHKMFVAMSKSIDEAMSKDYIVMSGL